MILAREEHMTEADDGSLREKVRERLAELIGGHAEVEFLDLVYAAADAIMREFALRPVASGIVTGEGEVEMK